MKLKTPLALAALTLSAALLPLAHAANEELVSRVQQFFFGDGAEKPAGFVPPSEA